MRLIDADALRDKLDLDLARWLDSSYEYEEDKSGYVAMHEAIKLVIDATTIDAAPVVHGEWVPHKIDGYENMLSIAEDVCSVCGQDFLEIRETGCVWNYCPNCGAKMDGAET